MSLLNTFNDVLFVNNMTSSYKNESANIDMMSTSGYPPPMTIPAQVVVIVMYSTIICVSVGGNLLVIVTVVTIDRMKSVINYFILNLACADILIALFCIPTTLVVNVLLQHWPFGEELCKIFSYSQVRDAVCCELFTIIMSWAK